MDYEYNNIKWFVSVCNVYKFNNNKKTSQLLVSLNIVMGLLIEKFLIIYQQLIFSRKLRGYVFANMLNFSTPRNPNKNIVGTMASSKKLLPSLQQCPSNYSFPWRCWRDLPGQPHSIGHCWHSWNCNLQSMRVSGSCSQQLLSKHDRILCRD